MEPCMERLALSSVICQGAKRRIISDRLAQTALGKTIGSSFSRRTRATSAKMGSMPILTLKINKQALSYEHKYQQQFTL